MTTLETTEQFWPAPTLRQIRPGAETAGHRAPGVALRRMLVIADVGAAALGWGSAIAIGPGIGVAGGAPAVGALTFVLLVALTVASVGLQRLYLSRVCAIRSVEISRLARAAAIAGATALLLPRLLPVALPTVTGVVGATASFFLLMLARGAFRSWLHAGRRDGRFLRPVVIVGANDEGYELFRLIRDHPETGFRVAGVLGSPVPGVLFPPSVTWMRSRTDFAAAVHELGANGVLVAATALEHDDLNRYIRDFLRLGLHVHLSSGLRGVAHRRLRSQPVAHEPFFYVEPVSLAPWQLATKRAIDVAVTLVGSVAVAPVLLLAALAVKLHDRGPVFFKQERIGRDGVPFRIVKIRTMVPNAEAQYEQLAKTHAGREGPLIKLTDDPRRTPVGRLLERLSIDELPQLWNVLKGEMSLVGPRPAQASEIAAFDEELRGRLAVAPGITGLWQVEARDNPSFSAYRRYDLFYIENWSMSLDLGIMVATFQRVALRGVDFLLHRRSNEMSGAHPRAVANDVA